MADYSLPNYNLQLSKPSSSEGKRLMDWQQPRKIYYLNINNSRIGHGLETKKQKNR